MMIMYAVLLILSFFIIALIGVLVPAIVSKVRIAYAVRSIPRSQKNHWLFGGLLYLTDEEGNLMRAFRTQWLPMATKGHKLAVTRGIPGLDHLDLLHPDTIRHAIGPDPKSLTDYFAFEPWLGNGLLISNGARWSRHRKLLTSAFHFDILKSYIQVFSECTSVFMNKVMAKQANASSVDVVPNVRLFTLDVLLRCICGQETHCQEEESHVPYVEAVNTLCSLTLKRILYPPARISWIYAFMPMKQLYSKNCSIVHKFSSDIIKKRRELIADGRVTTINDHRKYLDFIDVLLAAKDEDGQGLTDLEIREEVDTFVFEGHDTTASSLSWILYLLAKHPEHQTKCREEIEQIFNEKDEVVWDDLKRLTYVHYCMKEANRLYPPVPAIARELATPKLIDNKWFPKGTPVWISIYTVHHNPHVWDDPETFDPLRFTPENSKGRDPLAHIPFSAGARNCIGQNFAVSEQKVFLAHFLHEFEILLDEEKSTEPKSFIILHPSQVYLKLKKRCQNTNIANC